LGGVGIGPGGDTDGCGSVDDDVGGAAGLDDRGVVAAIALEPSLEVRFWRMLDITFRAAVNPSMDAAGKTSCFSRPVT
jgi:hypothetical protein